MLAQQMRLQRNLVMQKGAVVGNDNNMVANNRVKAMSKTLAVQSKENVIEKAEILPKNNEAEFRRSTTNFQMQQMMAIKRQIKAQQLAMKKISNGKN